ncbi:putative Holliday junction resolvase [bacterium BMS3Abin03]|nr:putative Holliday junction resolvase [bacterium BMS3Abin03]
MIEQRVMGIDFGEKRIGIALSDPLLIFAYAHLTFENDNNIWKKLKNLIESKKVVKVILGLPNKDKNPELTEKVFLFKGELEKRFSLKVITWDERFTSLMAQARIIESVPKKKNRRDKGLIDRNSAAIILEEYLNSL